MKTKLSSRDSRAVRLGLLVLAVIGLVRFAAMPWADNWLAVREQLALDRQTGQELEAQLARAIGQQRRLAVRFGPAVGKTLQDVEAARIGLFKAAQEVAQSSGLQPEAYQPQPDRAIKELPGVRLVPLEIRAKCQADQLAKCLAGLSKSDTLLLVDRLSASGGEKGSGPLDIAIVLATLAQPSAAAEAKGNP